MQCAAAHLVCTFSMCLAMESQKMVTELTKSSIASRRPRHRERLRKQRHGRTLAAGTAVQTWHWESPASQVQEDTSLYQCYYFVGFVAISPLHFWQSCFTPTSHHESRLACPGCESVNPGGRRRPLQRSYVLPKYRYPVLWTFK